MRAHVAVTCHLHFWQNDWGLLRATAVTRGGGNVGGGGEEVWLVGTDIDSESVQKVNSGEEHSSASPAGVSK